MPPACLHYILPGATHSPSLAKHPVGKLTESTLPLMSIINRAFGDGWGFYCGIVSN